jgi:hypothetical protein
VRLFPAFCNVLGGLIDFHMVNHPSILGINPAQPWYIILLICCWIYFPNMLKISTSVFIKDISPFTSSVFIWLWYHWVSGPLRSS